MSRPPLSGFVVSSKEGDDLSSARTREGFDPNAYKLMQRAGYEFQNPAALGKVVEAKPHGLTETQRKIQEQGGSVAVLKLDWVSRHHSQSESLGDEETRSW